MKKHEKNRCRKCLALALGLAPTLLLVVCVALLAATHNPRKSFFGRRFQIALTSSMAPRIRKNELLVIKNAIPEELQVGDIAVLAFGNDSDNRFLVSRVTMASQKIAGLPGQFIRTKGDANAKEDPPVAVERVVGKVTGHMLGPGLLVKYLRQLAGLSALLAILTVSLGWVLCALLWPRKMSDNSLSEIQEENLHAT